MSESKEIGEWSGQVLAISSRESYDLAVDQRAAAKDFIDRADAFFEPMHRKALESYREVQGKWKQAKAPAEEFLATVNKQLASWHEREETRLQLEAGRGLADEAEVEEAGKDELREQLEKAGYDPESVAAAVESSPTKKRPGPSTALAVQVKAPLISKKKWTAEVTDLFKLVKFVASKEGRRFLHLVEASLPKLNELARTQKGELDIPGVRAVSETKVADRPRGR